MGVKAKEKYRLENGDIVPGTTTILQELGWNKNTLVSWANRLGLLSIEARGFVDDKASIGKLAHAFVLAEFKSEQPNTEDYTAKQIELAKNCLSSYREWKEKRKVEPILIEKELVSEEFKYGGTPDFFGKIDEVLTLMDYKTGKGIYPEYIIQVSAYHNLIKEKGHEIQEIRILSIPRASDESFSEKIVKEDEIKAGFEIFKHLLAVYNLKGAIKKER